MKRFATIREFHQFKRLPGPEHPLISVINVGAVDRVRIIDAASWSYGFYCVAIKRIAESQYVKVKYGQQVYDFDGGIMSFVAPGQVVGLMVDKEEVIIKSGWLLCIHPDFFWNTPLAKTIRRYDFWDYSVNEALFLSEKEETIVNDLVHHIRQEYHTNIDKFSKNIIISHLEALFNYADRFYHRQFLTREKANHQVLERLEDVLDAYFGSDDLCTKGLPTVAFVAQSLNVSPKYLSSMLKTLTGQNTQQHIHEKLIEKAKEKLSSSTLTVSEIAYELGFEHLQSFSKLFKAKTKLSPLAFRASFE
ncbi:AraC family transcriptional regulator [Chitinophaga parva]|uniref:AraC family transcriptional regulator n=1 Tax=Chitinophaga parva TaxID=2169414 RepID=A0A2T7BD20_9BACT|nr:helix-turn-helix transcriptional regulator [Chitinophaga parva]PUZ22991.1 AraC family transcriptional regulator [Chitinophaga parva]